MLEGLTPPDNTPPCAVRRMLQNLEESDQRILEDALNNHEVWAHVALAKALTERGLRISEKPIRKHRIGLCSCK